MSVMTRNSLGDPFVKGLAAKLHSVVDQADKDYALVTNTAFAIEGNNSTKLFKTLESSQARESIGGLTAFGDLEQTAETEDFKNDDYESSYQTQYNFFEYTKNVELSRIAIADGQTEAKLQDVGRLFTAAKRTVNKHSFESLNQAFTAQASLNGDYLAFYSDGVPTCSTLHPLKAAGGTTSNASSTGIPLSEINLETARIALMQQVGDRGELLGFANGEVMLVVPHTLEKLAMEISGSKLKSNTANNDVNVYRGGLFPVMSTRWLSAANGGSDTAWFLVDGMESPLVVFFREHIRTYAPWTNDSNKGVNFDISGRWSVGPRTWRGMWGSQGAGAAYSS